MEKVSFRDKQLYVGIDVHKKQWSVSIFSDIHHKTFSQPPNPESLKAYLDKHFPDAKVECAYEASKFGFWIYRQLQTFGYKCMVVNPGDIPTSNKDSTEKTDPVDSRKIARALRGGLLKGIHVPGEQTEGYRQLFRYRKKLWADLVRIKNRIKDKLLFSGVIIPEKFDQPFWSHAFLNWLKTVEFPATATRQVTDMLLQQYGYIYDHFKVVSIGVRQIQKLPPFKQDAKLLRSIPGIGPLTTVQLLTEIDGIERFSSFKKFNSYVGLKPRSYSSGEHDWKGRLTYRSHSALRSALIECAWTSVQQDPAMMSCYEQLRKRLTAKRAIVKIARKLLSRIYHVLKTKEAYVTGVVA